MSKASFVHLRVHTACSLAEGAIHIKDLMKQCQGHAMPAVAMTDTNNMFAGLEFSEAGKDAGVQPIVGVSLSVTNPFITRDLRSVRAPKPNKLILLAQSEQGYQNLMKLVSKAHLEAPEGEEPQIRLDDLDGLSAGIIALTGAVSGLVGQLLLMGQADKAESCLKQLQSLFPNRLYMELQRHGLDAEANTEEAFLDLAYRCEIPLVATNEAYFTKRSMYEAHDTLLCIADSTYVAESERRRLTPSHYFRSSDEMVELFSDLPEAIENTITIAKRCAYKVEKVDPILPNFAQGLDVSETDMLRDDAKEGLKARLAFIQQDDNSYLTNGSESEKPYWDRLDFELKIINQMGFPGYFLIVSDFIHWAKAHNIPVGPGRGSGAGSVVAWALSITDLDPLRFSLLFERFLNPERISMPDFDIDFCQDKRELVIKYVQDKYGHDQVAQIITFGKLQARAVLKACGRVMQQPYPVTDRLAKLIPSEPGNAMTLSEALKAEPRLAAEVKSDELTAQVMDRALKLEGLYSHSSTHAAGVVIGDRPLDQLVPLYRDPKSDMPVTQFNMKWVEKAGLVKFDFLGLKTLTVLDRAVDYIKQRDIHIDLSKIPLDDAATYEMLSLGDAAGVFQLESTGMRSVLKGLRPDTFEDIIAIVALYRPGPMANIPTYVDRKHGREKVELPHEMLEDILGETYGVIIYQEQVMQIAQVMSGYSLGRADLLRRAMGKKIASEMEEQRTGFVEGAVENGVTPEKASYIFDLVAKFAEYGFNKSHAAAYALVAYHTAYLKANYPVEFMAAIMTLDMGNTDKLGAFKKELTQMDIPLLLPNINTSEAVFTVQNASEDYCEGADDPRQNLAVSYALAGIKGVGEKAIEAIVEERRKNGLFKDMIEFSERVDARLLNRRQMEQLTAAGAFDCINENRAQVFSAAEVLMRTAQMAQKERESDQVSLFGGDMAEVVDQPTLPQIKAWTESELLAHELKAIGYYLSAHPLDSYGSILARERILPAHEVMHDPGLIGQTVRMAGAIDNYREGTSKKNGKRFGAMTLSDASGGFELLLFEDDLERTRALVAEGAPVVVQVQVRKRPDDDGVRLSCKGMESLETVASQSGAGLLIELKNEKALAGIKAALDYAKGGKGKITFRVPLGETTKRAEIVLKGGHKVTPQLQQAIEAEIGVLYVEEN